MPPSRRAAHGDTAPPRFHPSPGRGRGLQHRTGPCSVRR
ncbi:Hypothetical protein AA314_06073 [Archangium gephyra]|uniref:Uncharacterized protein n=1 Tax=Archangium gephyra TaxID=48 RepID=A0AAC8QB49_9BACT|nr:Hypothetical protein AA314_06073 [Archangium gephyra]